VSIEQVAALSSEDALPEPTLDLDRIQASNSTFTAPIIPYRQNTVDPWNPAPKYGPPQNPSSALSVGGNGGLTAGLMNGAQSSLSGTGLPPEWWKRLESVKVTILGQQGFILNRYTVYEIMTEVRIS
jgi:sorting nexin-8